MCNGKWGGCLCHKICAVLLVVGGLNWGLVGLGMLIGNDLNVVNMLLGAWPKIEAIVYLLVGVAAIMNVFHCKCKKCMETCGSCGVENMENKM